VQEIDMRRTSISTPAISEVATRYLDVLGLSGGQTSV